MRQKRYIPVIIDGKKVCSRCKENKTIDNYTRNHNTKLGMPPHCKACAKVAINKYYIKNRDKLQKDALARYKRLRLEILSHYSPNHIKCACPGCNIDTLEFLSVDHIDGGGNQHRKTTGGFYNWLKRNSFPLGFQILCNNCNMAKAHYGQCPHVGPNLRVNRLVYDKTT